MIYKVSFSIEKPKGSLITDEDFIEFLKSELTLKELSEDNLLEFYALENHTKDLKIEPV